MTLGGKCLREIVCRKTGNLAKKKSSQAKQSLAAYHALQVFGLGEKKNSKSEHLTPSLDHWSKSFGSQDSNVIEVSQSCEISGFLDILGEILVSAVSVKILIRIKMH